MVWDKISYSKRGLMIAGLGFLVTTLGGYVPLKSPLVAAAAEVTYQNYSVVAGDSLYFIGLRFGVTVQELMTANNLTATNLQIGQVLRVPSSSAKPTYTVQANDTLYFIAKRFGTTVQQLKSINGLNSDILLVGQVLKLPVTVAPPPPIPSENNAAYAQYKVCAGDSLYLIGKKYGISVNQLMSINNLQSTEIWADQILLVPAAATPSNPTPPTSEPAPPASSASDSLSWTIPQGTALVHVKSGQTIWGLANEYNTTATAIMTTNHLHVDWVGVDQPLFIPVNSTQAVSVTAPKIAAKPGYGEFLDWEYVYWIFDIGNHAVIKDLATGKRFSVKRMGGSNHADCEPLTSADTQIMKDIFGAWGWKYRPVLVEVDGRVLAGSMAGMPHDIDTIVGNDFNGHFDVHFLNSRQHNTNEVTPEHQTNVRTAAGY